MKRIFLAHGKAWVAVFFLLLALLGCFTAKDYGLPWDTTGEMGILRMSLMEYAGKIPLQTPWKQALEDMQTIPVSQSIERDHGVSLYYPLFWAVCQTDWSLEQTVLIWNGYTWLVFLLGAFALYALARALGLGRLFACAGALLLVLTPAFFAHGHYNNKDIALMSLTLVVLWQTLRLLQRPCFSRAVGFALAAGFCVNTKVIGVAVCGLCGLMLLARLALDRRLTPKMWGLALATFAMSALWYFVLTPAFLADPVGFMDYLLHNAVGFTRWHATLLFDGKLISAASQRPPRSYLPVMIGLTTPLWQLALLFVGQALFVRQAIKKRLALLKNDEGFLLTCASLLWLLPLLGGIALNILVYNGWRHSYFLYGPMVLVMTYGIQRLWHRAQRAKFSPWPRRALAGGLGCCLLLNAVGIGLNHPYQYGYYNALVPREGLEARFELDYWNVSCVNALRELLANTQGPVQVAPSDFHTRSGLMMAIDYLNDPRLKAVPYDPEGPHEGYVLSNLGYAKIYGFAPTPNMRPVVTLSSYGVPMTKIYEYTPEHIPTAQEVPK